ncbi:sialate O-acetylesterase [Sphingobacterium paucimobilis]|uniref:Sialate O-acetylesterase domain-containing protein n=1 Tax=Sphingobacterium paucimobilis HER1398 TaxID=1346330 RepID=U2I0B6_9SPHI|nr:sialate O-acetylesterase [Sphingobacterium paucimobilis]ERJ60960.1 hypothetical protein M472_19585 [Sphingobacterium paucimobilis HER1398]
MKKLLLFNLLLVIVTANISIGYSKVKLPRLVGDGMVLQRNVKIPIWGWADSLEIVEVSFKGKKYKTQADQSKRWSIQLESAEAGGPYQMTVKGIDSEYTISDIYIGDVWLCSGQSNMNWRMKQIEPAYSLQPEDNFTAIRHIEVGRKGTNTPEDDILSIGWRKATPEQLPAYSAVAYFFAKELHQKLNVPIGLISASWGGATAESWASQEALTEFPHYLARFDSIQDPEKVKVLTAKKELQVHHEPIMLYNGMIAPVVNYGMKGVIWYQGESNVSKAEEYKHLMPALVENWRKKIGQGNIPFLFVQLANYKAYNPKMVKSEWAELRDAQLNNWKTIPNSGMAVAIDVGEAKDIHPKNKWTVGQRLALSAQYIAYGNKQVVYSGPIYKELKIVGNKARLSFDHLGSGLSTRNNEALSGFYIAGADGNFVPATAVIVKDKVEVSSTEVSSPVSVRYAWQDNPETSNLINKEGLPASPFKTDR